ncbi:DEAD/DEAH box helicase family protein [Hymenobacter coalescens]
MKLHFESHLDYQQAAVDAVCDLFRGQETGRNEFTVAAAPHEEQPGAAPAELGVGNCLRLAPKALLANLRAVQLRHGLPAAEQLRSADFTVEMETGTGKTYVYLRTAFELHRRYGFSKFVVVVPSVAIKEGVYKTLQITAEHFRGLYAGVPCEYFIYDSGKLGQVRGFATSPHIQVMIVTVGAINKFGDETRAAQQAATDRPTANVLYRPNDKTGGERPVDLIRATRPVVIIDEPQSVDGGLSGQGRRAIERLAPLCTLRYSATHADKHHMVYRLDAVDAYERQLVKQIEVAALAVTGPPDAAYVKLLATRSRRRKPSALVEVETELAGRRTRQAHWLLPGAELEPLAGRAVYAGYRVGAIRAGRKDQRLELLGPRGAAWLLPDRPVGGPDPAEVKRRMIRRTIQAHLDKELRLLPLGIKVLSLFFVDAVERYRRFGPDRTAQPGEYARVFEQEYCQLIRQPRYRALWPAAEPDWAAHAAAAHAGYFSVDRKGGWTDTAENNKAGRDNAERAYSLIMRDKERLLSVDTPLRFIFSHSALREGWDNPNVFQVCALRDMGSERERRQTIGRGLRLCVNQHGERVRDAAVNTLTVVASESYEEFADHLQRETEADTGLRLGVVEAHQLAGLQAVDVATGEARALGPEPAQAMWQWLRAQGYLDAKNRVLAALRTALREHTLVLPAPLAAWQEPVAALLRQRANGLGLRNADAQLPAPAQAQAVGLPPELEAVWHRIRQHTLFRAEFDDEPLIQACVLAVRQMPSVVPTPAHVSLAGPSTGPDGAAADAPDEAPTPLPDVLTELQERTQLTRRSLARILTASHRLPDFQLAPRLFIEQVGPLLNRCQRRALAAGIHYERAGSSYVQKLCGPQELTEHRQRDGTAPGPAGPIQLFAELPAGFSVPTPLGLYYPRWALLVRQQGTERLYFVAGPLAPWLRSEAQSCGG